jgi:chromate reductase
MVEPIRVLGIPGSLRKESFNRGLLVAAQELCPEGMEIEIFDLHALPFYNKDVHELGFPESVQELREKIRVADAMLIATPEYLHSISGALQNAFDWASRKPDSPLTNKPLAIMGATTGEWGTARAQSHLRLVAIRVRMLTLNRPEILVANARDKFENGRLVDEETRTSIQEMLEKFASWTLRLKG